jgi:hypothetical protein
MRCHWSQGGPARGKERDVAKPIRHRGTWRIRWRDDHGRRSPIA